MKKNEYKCSRCTVPFMYRRENCLTKLKIELFYRKTQFERKNIVERIIDGQKPLRKEYLFTVNFVE